MNQYIAIGLALIPLITSIIAAYVVIDKKVERALVLIEGLKELVAHNEKHRADIIEEFKVMFERDLRGINERTEHNAEQIDILRREFYEAERKRSEILTEIKSLITSKR